MYRVLAVVASGVLLMACGGENIFPPFPIAGGSTGPTVEITTPTSGAEALLGDSILVEATVEALSGASTISYSGVYEADDAAAYTAESADGNGLTTLALTNYLRAAPGQTEGQAVVVVRVTDLAGSTGADSVTVNIVLAN